MDEARLEAQLRQLRTEMNASLEAATELIRAAVERLERSSRPEPTCLTYPVAAAKLGVGVTKLKEMIKAKEIHTTKIGKVPMVTVAEIIRITTPKEERAAVTQAAREKNWVPLGKKRYSGH